MFLATGDAKYADVTERALYNGVISGVSLSGDRFFYDNPLESMGQHERQYWFGCACCPGNITRFMASVPYYMYAVQGDDIYVNLYIRSEADIKTDNNSVKVEQETDYPWEGKIRLTVHPEKEQKFALRLRIPGWVQDSPVPSDLYSFTSKAEEYTVKLNGSKVKVTPSDGYATLVRRWKAGDVLEIDLPMEVRRIKAHENVEDDRGKLAIERGPIIFCLEGKDQADSIVFNKFIPDGTPIRATYQKDLLNGVIVLTGTAKEVAADGSVKDVPFKAIPYATWNNRGTGQMVVWIPESAQYARPIPEPTIASKAQTMWGVNDQWEPKRSSDISKPYHYWWLKKGTEETITCQFDQPYTVSNVQVYWLDFDHYDGDYRIPESWKLFYRKGAQWKEAEALTPYTVEKDCYNSLDFKPVTTTALKISAQLQKGESGGVIEWKVQ
jgi:hypothetical protein